MAWPRRMVGDWLAVTARAVLATWFGVVALFTAVDAFENLRDYTRFGASSGEIAIFFALRTPDVAFQIMPAAVLLGSLLALFRLAKAKELTAAEASGLHPGWVYAVPLGIAAVLATVHFGAEQSLLPASRAMSDAYQAETIERNPLRAPSPVRYLLHGEQLWRVAVADSSARQITVETYARRGERLIVDRYAPVVRRGDAWVVPAGQRISYPPLAVTAAPVPSIPFLPEELSPLRPPASQMPWLDAVRLVWRKQQVDPGVTQLELSLHQRTSWVLLSLTVLLAALPFLPRHGRRTSTALGVLIALVIGLGGWGAVVVGSAMAASLKAPAAYWLPHGLLTLTGLMASTRIRARRRRPRPAAEPPT